jgi:hypothetical protein
MSRPGEEEVWRNMSTAAQTVIGRPRRDVLFEDYLVRFEAPAHEFDLLTWVGAHRSAIERDLRRHGGVLFQGFDLTVEQFARVTELISPESSTMDYVFGLAPRTKYADGLYLSTLAPKESTIQQHHEMSYLPDWPMKVFFYCDIPATNGGETTLCSTKQFMRKIDPAIVERFADRRVRYMRNYEPGLGQGVFPGWERSFQTSDKAAIETYCRARNIAFAWDAGDVLRTSTIGQGVAMHPRTGELLWHNHAYNMYLYSADTHGAAPFLRAHAPGLAPDVVARIMSAEASALPFHTSYGDGSPIERSIIETISATLEEETRKFPWHRGDCLVLDNMLSFHGRAPFEGERRTLAVMKEPFSAHGKGDSQ